MWVVAIVLVLASSKGGSSVALIRMLGVTQKTAWRIGHAVQLMIREVGAAPTPYEGTVEVNSTLIGGAPRPQMGVPHPPGRGTYRQPVLMAAERGGRVWSARHSEHWLTGNRTRCMWWMATNISMPHKILRTFVGNRKTKRYLNVLRKNEKAHQCRAGTHS